MSFLTSILSQWLAGNELPLCSPQITSAPFSSKVTCRATSGFRIMDTIVDGADTYGAPFNIVLKTDGSPLWQPAQGD